MPAVSAYWTLETLARHDVFLLRVREAEFIVSRSQLVDGDGKHKAGILSVSLLGEFKEASTRSMFLDRDPTTYPMILQWLDGVRLPSGSD